MQKGEFLEAHALYSSLISMVSTDDSEEKEVVDLGTLPKDLIKQDAPSDLIKQLVDLYNSGDLSGAIERAKELASQYPKAFDIWNIMGAAAAQLEQFDQAVIAFQNALEIRPDDAKVYNNMGSAYKIQEKFQEAANCYKRALELNPDYAEACYNLGVAYMDLSMWEDAAEAFTNTSFLNPNHAEAKNNLGAALEQLGMYDEAMVAYKNALIINPDYAEAHKNLGTIFQKTGMLDDAILSYKAALLLKPDFNEALNDLGTTLERLGKLDEAINCFNELLILWPDHPEACNNLGCVLQKKNMRRQAIALHRKALALKPDFPEAFYSLGVALMELNKLDEALVAYKNALALRINYPEAQYNLGKIYLSKNDFKQAFELLEWRWMVSDRFIGTQFQSDKPVWDGSGGAQVLVWREQGIGDEIMFSSMFPELNKKSNKIIIECDSRLLPLYKRSFSENIVFLDDRNEIDNYHYDSQIALGSLPRYLRSRVEDFRHAAPGWLKTDPERVHNLRTKLKALGNDRIIGVSWSTSGTWPQSKSRNISLDLLASHLARIPATFVSLQYGDTAEEILSVNGASDINIESFEEIDLFSDIDGLAALISACDMVISIDNATVHLAGALGVDTRVLLPFMPDERWGLGRSDSYWYDQLKLYRQEKEGDWTKPLDLLISEISKLPIGHKNNS